MTYREAEDQYKSELFDQLFMSIEDIIDAPYYKNFNDFCRQNNIKVEDN